MPEFILPFSSPSATLALAGGKGLNLSRLARAGFPVPPGFIVSTEAYHAFVAANQLQARILATAEQAAPDDPQALESAAREIGALFEQGQVLPDLRAAVQAAYRQLASSSPAAVAVRSSATAEDLPGLSFAGQQETYLNVVGEAEVLRAVQRCWASLWTARAIGYRAHNHIAPQDVGLAVVVQQMIPAEAAGVLFTANPLTGRRDEMVIDASFGLGEAIVSGQVEADHYVVDGPSAAITERKLGRKALRIVPRAGGGTEQVQAEAAGQQALPDEQIVALARLAARAAEHYGEPQDIEWAWAGGQLYLLQSRPITSLYPLPEVPVPPGATGVYFSVNSIQGLIGPLSPLGRDTLRLVLGGVLLRIFAVDTNLSDAITDAGGRMWLNFTEPARDPALRRLVLALLERADPGAKRTLLRLIDAGRLPLKPGGRHGPPRFILHVLPRALPGLMLALIAPRAAVRRGLAQCDRFLAEVRQQARTLPSGLEAQLAFFKGALLRTAENVVLPLVPAVMPAVGAMSLLDEWLVRWCGAQPGTARALMRGLSGNVTTEMNLKLWAAARTIQAEPAAAQVLRTRPIPELVADYRRRALPPVAQAAAEQFLAEYGMRAVGEIDIAEPRWRDDPSSVFQTLQAYVDIADPEAAPDVVFRRGAEEAQRLAREYAARARHGPLGFLRSNVLRFAIGRMRALAGSRETPKLYIIKVLDVMRPLVLQWGQALTAAGDLAAAGDIFYVTLDDLQRKARGEAVDLKGSAARNRAEYEREAGRRQMPRLLLSTGEAFYEGVEDEAAGPDVLAGEAVSAGVAEGLVRVVLDPSGTRLEPGEILVCPATNPGWTPLFLAAGGLVMEIGGLVTHGSVVAREYGIPAVVGVQDATTRLKTGQRVRVDGNTGRVTVISNH